MKKEDQPARLCRLKHGIADMENQNATIAILGHKVDALHQDVGEMKSALKDVAMALNKLTLVEERQSHSNATQKRMMEKIDGLEGRVDALEKADVKHGQAATWVMNAVWAAAGLLCMYVAKLLGLV